MGLSCFLNLVDCFFSHVWKVFSYYVFKYFLKTFLSPPSGTHIMPMLVYLKLSQRSLRLSSFLFILFSMFCGSDFHHSVLQVIYPFFCLSYSVFGHAMQCWSGFEEIPNIQGQRNPSKMVSTGAAAAQCWSDFEEISHVQAQRRSFKRWAYQAT